MRLMTVQGQDRGKPFGGVLIVVHHQNAATYRRQGLRRSLQGQRPGHFGNSGQADHELAPAAKSLAVRFNRPVLHLDERFHQRESEA